MGLGVRREWGKESWERDFWAKIWSKWGSWLSNSLGREFSQCKLRDGEEVSMATSGEQGTDEQVQADCVGRRLCQFLWDYGRMAAYQPCKMEGSRRVESRGWYSLTLEQMRAVLTPPQPHAAWTVPNRQGALAALEWHFTAEFGGNMAAVQGVGWSMKPGGIKISLFSPRALLKY